MAPGADCLQLGSGSVTVASGIQLARAVADGLQLARASARLHVTLCYCTKKPPPRPRAPAFIAVAVC